MQRNAVWLSAVTFTGIVVFFAGCQFPGVRSAKHESPADRERPLNDRQVADVQLSLARSLEQRGEIEPALKAYEQAVEKDPRRATGYWRMAILQDRQGNVEESARLYRHALKLDAKNPDLLCDYGYSLYLQRRWAESEERLRQAIALKPKHLRAHNNLGMVLAQAERADEALAEFRKAGCGTDDAHSNLAFVMTLNHRWDEARKQYELALDAKPDSEVALSGLENLDAVMAKATSHADSIELTNYERPAQSRPGKSVKRTTSKRSAFTSDISGDAKLSTTSEDDL